ncbi:MAG: endonuclease/exonuclease/phosphatase family protein [Acidobacteriota bacterium]|nr:endonuclease/exonuclease/phosphatase family protein [Blastocatellia bacterium]MDW8240637.1 endonuclease/exonuclease/phosphatase family protein [Acidobacteriota bacterium]
MIELVEDDALVWFGVDELLQLAQCDDLPRPLQEKLDAILTTPVINNRAYRQGSRPHRPLSDQLGPLLRVAFWNVARGERLDDMLLALTDAGSFLQQVRPDRRSRVAAELDLLQAADVLALNEVDIGLERTGYRHVVGELAVALGMNYAFGVEFIELAPLLLGSPDAGYRGLHGNAVLSRYPIRRAIVRPYHHQGFDWYRQEKQFFCGLTTGDSMRSPSAPVARALSFCQLRRGGRTALIVELDVPDLPEGRITVVTTHLENRCSPAVRRQQMGELLHHLRAIDHPVIITGDLNTSGRDGTPGLAHKFLLNLTASGPFWCWLAPRIAPALGWLNDLRAGSADFWATERDPTRDASPERGLFDDLYSFRFDDGRTFDFRGDPARTVNRLGGLLANSNERTGGGFVPTSETSWACGLIGRSKLDWILVKPYLRAPQDPQGSYRFAPHFARTLRELNALSDHRPLLVDLPLYEPRV